MDHDPEALLQEFFARPGFRPQPVAPDGTSLQRAVTVAGLQGRSLLAILPTGAGKSICYQLPALAHYRRTGRLTVIVSPLQSLMRDQVDHLLGAGHGCALTINGLLSPLERRVALDRIKIGEAGIALVSPEQFRSRGFTETLRVRDIATWVFDEAHCLSKWGHDFRTDYLYVARWIRENCSRRVAPIACFTATAKPEVIEDLRGHFRETLDVELECFDGGHARENLRYRVVAATKASKPARIVELLRAELAGGGAAIVFCAKRRGAEQLAMLIDAQGIACGCFHGGLTPEQKKLAQQRFIDGELPVIAATNAFGMGVDKADIRLVVHADIPGSLENYLQESGRAGRDGAPALCVLLFDVEDVEAQFRLAAAGALTKRDFTTLLRAVRARVMRMKCTEIAVTPRELLEDVPDDGLDSEAADSSTKIATAIAWLERGRFLQRDENSTRVLPVSLRVASLGEAIDRIAAAALTPAQQGQCRMVLAVLFRGNRPEGMSTDELMAQSGIPASDAFGILRVLESLGILVNELGLTIRLSKGVRGASESVFATVVRAERALLELLAEAAPHADGNVDPRHLGLRQVCTELRSRMGLAPSDQAVSPQLVSNCLRSLCERLGDTEAGRPMLSMRKLGRDSLRITVERPWRAIREICRRRSAVAQAVLARLLSALPAGTRDGSAIVECRPSDLLQAIESDLEVRSALRDPALALEQALLYLHANKVLELNKGRSIFRPAMTLRVGPELNRRFLNRHFEPLQAFYRERTLQTHVMHEYARIGLARPDDVSGFVHDYFTMSRRRFLRAHFKGRTDLLELATTDDSLRRIVDDLRHPVQQALVEAPLEGNQLVLAGPGSGKTRVIVHRIAYLLRVRRVAAQGILALAFNRAAANALRRRLFALAGDDARGVTVLTYHALALRLTGTSLAEATRRGETIEFDRMLRDAVDLLQGRGEAVQEPDALRERLLAGYRFIFVDEYQDVDATQDALISALAGRRCADPDARLAIMAVGDDDQNIYAFKGAQVEFIRRFQADYDCALSYLVENFRSTQAIIAASNRVIQPAADRMKAGHPIRIDAARLGEPPGGAWARLDPVAQGRVRLIDAAPCPNRQAQLAMREIRRLGALDPATGRPAEIAVLARTHAPLDRLRALCELEGIRFETGERGGSEGQVSVMKLREGHQLAALLQSRARRLLRPAALLRWIDRRQRAEPGNPHWTDLYQILTEGIHGEAMDEMPASTMLDALYEGAAELRRGAEADALRLMTAHAAKGLEFRHVIVLDCGDWRWTDEAERRLLYVAMTRARETLTLMRVPKHGNSPLDDLAAADGVLAVATPQMPAFRTELERSYRLLGPSDLDLGYAGSRPVNDPIHAVIGALAVGDAVRIEARLVLTRTGEPVSRLSAKAQLPASIIDASVAGLMVRTRRQTEPRWRGRLRVEHWEVPLVEVISRRGD